MGLYPVALRYNARQDNKIQYSTITDITQNNIQHSIRKITRISQEHILYTILILRNE
jgi:uncharacterized protein (UPF0333 family)